MKLSSANDRGDRLKSLDGLRGIAALTVVFSHAMLVQPFYWNYFFKDDHSAIPPQYLWIINSPLRLLWSGDTAVSLFFVLSGFVLALRWMDGRRYPYPNFLASRLCRIYLPYLIAMLVAGFLANILGGRSLPGVTDWINGYAWANIVTRYTAPSVLLMLGNQYSTWIDNPTWTLVWEMRVSLLFPLLVIPVARWGGVGAVGVTAVLALAFNLGHNGMAHVPLVNAATGRPYETFYYAAYFCAGAVLARYRGILRKFGSLGSGAVALALVITGLWLWFRAYTLPLRPDIWITSGAALLVIAAISEGRPQQWLNMRVVQWLGRVSYSLYLTHVPVILVGDRLLYPALPHFAIVVLAIPVALMIAEIFYRLVERPSHLIGRRLSEKMEKKDAIPSPIRLESA
jgi:peptidoglycan/LPS O-acetylase OafA/YrhL